jgi:hypothetical protein
LGACEASRWALLLLDKKPRMCSRFYSPILKALVFYFYLRFLTIEKSPAVSIFLKHLLKFSKQWKELVLYLIYKTTHKSSF